MVVMVPGLAAGCWWVVMVVMVPHWPLDPKHFDPRRDDAEVTVTATSIRGFGFYASGRRSRPGARRPAPQPSARLDHDMTDDGRLRSAQRTASR
jgi:hypothetical protein